MIDRDYTQLTDTGLNAAYIGAKEWQVQSIRTGNRRDLHEADLDLLAIFDEQHRRALKPRRHLAPERGRGRVGDTENGR